MATIKEELKNFLSETFRDNADFQDFAKKPLPDYITKNLAEDKKLRPYQELAVKTFIYFWQNNEREKCRHLLFNMATGTGKTLVMACCILFLYTEWYRKFIFFVSSVQILDQAKRGFTEKYFKKFLFAKNISLPNENSENVNVSIKSVKNFSTLFSKKSRNIEILFDTIQGLSSKINEDRENQIDEKDFEKEKIVFLADEAHHLNGKTKWKNEKDTENSWEGTIMRVFAKNSEHILLEFTATIDIKDKKIREKYEDKLLYRYDFSQFRGDRFCKEIGFLQSPKTHSVNDNVSSDRVEPQKRRTIINALVLSEYRKLIFERKLSQKVNPIILFKSANKASSKQDMEDVIAVINSLRVESLDYLQSMKYQWGDEYGVIAGMFAFLENEKISLSDFVPHIRMSFREENMILYNSGTKTTGQSSKTKKDEEKYVTNSLAMLDDEHSKIRAVFIVQALKEGWDVLSLFDLVHFDLNGDKKVEASDIQLVGRGARYFPFLLSNADQFAGDETSQTALFHVWENDKYKRKFDNAYDVDNVYALLETFYYHFVEEKNFLEKLKKELMLEGIVPNDGEIKTLKLKESFKISETYKNGFVLVNSPEKRQKAMTDIEEQQTFHKILEIRDYSLRFQTLSDAEKNTELASMSSGEFRLTEEFGFNYWLVNWALYYYKNTFFRFSNLKNHIIGLRDIRHFIDEYLPKYTISYFQKDKTPIQKRDAKERVNILMYAILPEIEKMIDTNLPKMVWSHVFRPRSIKNVFEDEKNIYVGTSDNERFYGQINHSEYPIDLTNADWYSHNENYGTTDEKKFVKFFESQIASLRKKYTNAEIFLMRNELDFYIYDFKNWEKFSPDYVSFINDFDTKTLYYQCLFEVKWGHLRYKDSWKETALQSLGDVCEISFETQEENTEYKKYLESVLNQKYKNIKNIGFGFYTANSPDNAENTEYQFLQEFEKKLL